MRKKEAPMPTASRHKLKKLARDANHFYDLAKKAESSALEYAKQCGEALCAARATFPKRGNWLSWVQAEFMHSSTTRENYMLIAREWDEKIAPNLDKVKYRSINGALSLLRTKKEPAKDKPAPGDLRQAYKAFKGLTSAEVKFCAQHPEAVRKAIRELVKVELPIKDKRDQKLRNRLRGTNESVTA